MKIIFIMFLLLSSTVGQFCLGVNIEDIKKSDKYYWGYGEAISSRKADQLALADLISQISVQVENKFERIQTRENGEKQEIVRSCINTYSSASLKNTLRKVWEEGNNNCVFRYIEKTELDKIFASRASKLKDYFKTGIEAEEKCRFADAISNYYWAFLLLRSHPDNQSMTIEYEPGNVKNLITEIPARIEALFAGLSFKIKEQKYIKDEKYRQATLDIRYKNNPVENIDYTYWHGDSWSPLQSGRDGIGAIQMFGEAARSLKNIRLRVEYTYEQKAQYDREVQAIIEDLDLPQFNSSEFRLNFPTSNQLKKNPFEVNVENIKQTSFNNGNTLANTASNYHEIIEGVVSAISKKQYEGIKKYFTTEGWAVFQKIIQYGKARLVSDELNLKMVNINNEVFIRSVPLAFNFPNNNRQFVEKVVFTLNSDMKISNLNFALSENAINDLISRDNRFGTEHEKFCLIHFMEVYKTSYCLKRIDFIESLFADDALIIVGKKIKKDLTVGNEMMPQFRSEDEYQFVKKSKGEYISTLRNVFRSSEFINIHFEDNQVKKARKDQKVYGIQIAQHYTSSTYADKGYLFLMVDLQDTASPKIYVRSWQPEKRADGSVIGLSDFVF